MIERGDRKGPGDGFAIAGGIGREEPVPRIEILTDPQFIAFPGQSLPGHRNEVSGKRGQDQRGSGGGLERVRSRFGFWALVYPSPSESLPRRGRGIVEVSQMSESWFPFWSGPATAQTAMPPTTMIARREFHAVGSVVNGRSFPNPFKGATTVPAFVVILRLAIRRPAARGLKVARRGMAEPPGSSSLRAGRSGSRGVRSGDPGIQHRERKFTLVCERKDFGPAF